MEKTVVVAAKRTPFGKFRGTLSNLDGAEVGAHAVKVSLDCLPSDINVDKLIFGQAVQAGCGQNIARQIALKAGLGIDVPAITVNQVCGSSMQALLLADQSIRLGEATCLVVGGVEMMSQIPKLISKTTGEECDGLTDGLEDAMNHIHMGVTAEKIADTYQISRAAQDEFAYQSHIKAANARKAGYFAEEIASMPCLVEDEGVRMNPSLEKMNQLSPVFIDGGSVTAGNSSSLSDGASAMVLMAESVAKAQGYPILARIQGIAEVGNDPLMMGMAPVKAVQKLLEKQHTSLEDYALFELNEAFASQSLAVIECLHLPKERVNVDGGAIAIGHPLGASGTRILMHLIYRLTKGERGIATLCIGGGMGIAIDVERV